MNTDCVADVLLVIDNSGSIRDTNPNGVNPGDPDDNWTILINFLQTITDSMNIGSTQSRVAAIEFGNSANVVFDFDDYSDKASLRQAIGNIGYRVSLQDSNDHAIMSP